MVSRDDRRKGVGYIIEAFVAALVIFIFAMSHHAHSPEAQNWDIFQSQVGANDLTYVMEKTGHTESMVRRGELGGLQSAFSGVSDNSLSVSGTIENTPLGKSRIGIYTLPSEIHTESLTELTSGDPCFGDLEEIDSEYTILHTDGSLESYHGVRLYVADTDPQYPDNFNAEKDYDTFWVDNGTTCQFSGSEGPHLIEDSFLWGNTTDSDPENFYDMKSISGSGTKQIVLHEADLASKLKHEIESSSNTLNVDTEFDSFNFTGNNLNYNLIVFKSKKSLQYIDSNLNKVMEFQKDGSVLLMANLNSTDLDKGFLGKTGLEWVYLDRTNYINSTKSVDNLDSRKTREYLRSLGCQSCGLNIESGGKITSSNGPEFMSNKPMLVGSSTGYDTAAWNSAESSMAPGSTPPSAPASGCGSTTAMFEFPTQKAMESLEVFNTELGGGGGCKGVYGVSIDLDKDGDFNEERETTYLDGDTLEVNGRPYKVKIDSASKVSFIYQGSDAVEFVNYRKNFPEQSIGRFAHMADITADGNIDDHESYLSGAVILWLLEDNENFGGADGTGPTTNAVGSIKDRAYIPYKIHLRWSR